MADKASAFLGGLSAGEHIAEIGIESYDRARAWRERLQEKEDKRKDAAEERKTEASRYAETHAEKVKKDKIDEDLAKATEKHLGIQDDLTRAEIDSIKKGLGRYGTAPKGNAAIPPEVKVAMANRDSARKSISALAAGGITTPPPDLQARLDAAEGALSRVAAKNQFDLGEDAQASADFHKSLTALQAKAATEADAKAHPVKAWFRRLTGQDHSAPANADGAKRRTATGPNGEKLTEVSPGVWQ